MSEREPDLHVVRNFMSERTHVMHVTGTTEERSFNVPYLRPEPGLAACGANIKDGVVMQGGTSVRCGPCKHVTGVTAEPVDD